MSGEEVRSLSVRDREVGAAFDAAFRDLYEVQSYRNASRILPVACPDEFTELVRVLKDFRISTADIVAGGKNKSEIAKGIERLFNPLGWNETRVRADLVVVREYKSVVRYPVERGPNRGQERTRNEQRKERYLLENFLDGHKVDFVKQRVAFDFEWNSKDQTFDRDLYAMRAFYDCGLIDCGVLLTRSAELAPVFREISSRVAIDKFESKFGASTTWMGKLGYRLAAGRGGGCPIIAMGIKPALIHDFEEWKAANPPLRAPINIDPEGATEYEADE
jgi:hypothetical protein